MTTTKEHAAMEQHLVALASALPYPPTPDLAAGFWRRLDSERMRPANRPVLSYAGLALSAAVVVLSVLIGVVTPARDAAADLFDRINIFETTESPAGLSREITGENTTIKDAQLALGRSIALPTRSGLTLEQTLLQDYGTAKAVVLFYRTADGREFTYHVSNTSVGKGLPIDSDSTYEPVPDVGEEAFWLTGDRLVQYYADGVPVEASKRATDRPALVWSFAGLVYRIEGELPQSEAVQIAQSVEGQAP